MFAIARTVAAFINTMKFFFYIWLVESCHSNHATGINFLDKTHGYCFKLLTTLFRACHVTLNGLVWSFTKLIIKSWNFAKTNYKQKIFVFSLYPEVKVLETIYFILLKSWLVLNPPCLYLLNSSIQEAFKFPIKRGVSLHFLLNNSNSSNKISFIRGFNGSWHN